MGIKQFIQEEVLRPRMRRANVLVVYDSEKRYRELCMEMANKNCLVVDATESSIESRELALEYLQKLGSPSSQLEGMLVYVPTAKPITDEEKQQNPFSIYGIIGEVFPDSDGDEYLSLCLKSKPDHVTEIQSVFYENPNPSFEVIDAIGEGSGGYPHLHALLGVESIREMLLAFLVPTGAQKKKLNNSENWQNEAKNLFMNTIHFVLKTRSKALSSISDELWRFLLFSEFAFDLPEALPETLAEVPKADEAARQLVEYICDNLRDSTSNQSTYIQKAEEIEVELHLPEICHIIINFGSRDTFPFEERSYFTRAVTALKNDAFDELRKVLQHSKNSIWSKRGENMAQWQLIQAAANLIQICDDTARLLPEYTSSFDKLIDYYITQFREVDQRQREFEQANRDLIERREELEDIIPHARGRYRNLAEQVHEIFIKFVERVGWPPENRLANIDVFDKLIAPALLQSGHRVALLEVDALRYELGVELSKQLHEEAVVDVKPAFAALPSITPVGMSCLLPNAVSKLKLVKSGNEMKVAFGDQELTQVAQRMDILKRQYGDRFTEMSLDAFLKRQCTIPPSVELLILRDTAIDRNLENNPDEALTLLHKALKMIRVAVHKLRSIGFSEAFIATDHGFYLNTYGQAGDVCAKPCGTWLNLHERIMLGTGSGDAANVVLPASQLGIHGDFSHVAFPRMLIPYRSGEQYFHGGLSLQEAIIPVISLKMHSGSHDNEKLSPVLKLSYKNGIKKITTRIPVIEVSAENALFGYECDVLLEAQDSHGKVIGEAKTGGAVNPATHYLHLNSGDTVNVPLKMDPIFEGKFTVKVLNPSTMTIYCKLELETDYTV